MTLHLYDTTPDIESALVDLGATPLAVLRTANHAALRESLRHVVDRTGGMRIKRISGGQNGGGRLD